MKQHQEELAAKETENQEKFKDLPEPLRYNLSLPQYVELKEEQVEIALQQAELAKQQ